MTRFLEAWKAPFTLEGSEMLARRKRVRERGTWSVLKLDSRPERVLEQGSPKVRCINNHTVSIQQLTVFRWFVSKTKSIGPPGRLTLGAGIQGRHSQTRLPLAKFLQPSRVIPTPKSLHSTQNSEEPFQALSTRLSFCHERRNLGPR